MATQNKTLKKNQTTNKGTKTPQQKVMLTLHNEHKYLSTLLDALDQQVSQLRPGGNPDYYTLRDMVDYLVNFPDAHHHPLEDAIYSKLKKRHKTSISTVEELLAEHKDMAKLTRSLKDKLHAQCEGKPTVKRPILHSDLEEYLQLYRQHINMEEGTSFPAAIKHLKEADWLEIAESMETPEDPIFGDRVARRYHKVVAALDAAQDELSGDVAMLDLLGTQALIESGSILLDGISQLSDITKHHFSLSWQEGQDLITEARDPDSGIASTDLPRLIFESTLQQCKDSLEHGKKIRQGVKSSLSETWSWQRDTFKKVFSRSESTG